MAALSRTTETTATRVHLRVVEPGRRTTLRQIARARTRREHLERLQLVACSRARPAVFAYWSAALLHDLPMLNAPPSTVHILAAGPAGSADRGVVAHPRTPELRPQRRHGLRVTSPAQTVAHLAGRTSFVEGVVIADHALAAGAFDERAPLATRAEIVGAAEHLVDPGERSRALAVARFADGRAESPLESVSRATMALAGAPPPELQVPLHDLNGLVGRLDFCWPALGLAGEADGAEKLLHPAFNRSRGGWDVLAARAERERRIEAAGLRVLRWRWETGRRVDRMAAFLANEGVPLDAKSRLAELGLRP
ncbi:hypothetical protein KNO15_20485 [Leifsonia shinshuensis]|uniref:hypothetical protein n=1 Tax=Leifsonia shinshuensis TaxID=150026 RepID=UPI001F51570D|nr:hypothetical protein [Leifsonia shinshuensis]MCI0159086.1 hypothetical protein [Leifsonia shinshuensis]